MFKMAIVRTPGKSMIHGVSSAKLGAPNYELARLQHTKYVEALESCGLEVVTLPPNESFPDSTFIEDVALLTPYCAIITNPGAPSRKGEIQGLRDILGDYYTQIEQIQAPGTLEAGDIMMVGNHYYIGLSARTNQAGAGQMIGFLEKYGMTGSLIELKQVLHLKTGVAYLENNNLLVGGEFLTHPEFQKFHILEIDASESYAANCIWINGKILLPAGYPIARKTIESTGYQVLEIDTSEFRKLDGGLSCLSLRF